MTVHVQCTYNVRIDRITARTEAASILYHILILIPVLVAKFN